MALCQKCGQEFLTTPEEERLIVTKAIEEVCMACAMAGAAYEEDPNKHPLPPLWPRRKFFRTQIIRVDLRDREGEVVSFIAMEPGPYFPKQRERKRPIHRPRVTIMGNPGTGREPNYVTIITNLPNFEKEDRDLFAMKIPDMWSPSTGVGEIRIDRRRVKKIEYSENGVLARLDDGYSVAGYYPIDMEFKYRAFP